MHIKQTQTYHKYFKPKNKPDLIKFSLTLRQTSVWYGPHKDLGTDSCDAAWGQSLYR